MMNAAVRAMLARAGFYLISADDFRNHYSTVEVEADGTCHQLTPTLKRDGILRPDRWADAVRIKGPFATAAEAEQTQRAAWYGPDAT